MGHRGQRLVSSTAGPESPLTLFAAGAGGVPAFTPAGEISSQLPTSPNPGLGMTQTQVHSARLVRGDMPGPVLTTFRKPLFLRWGSCQGLHAPSLTFSSGGLAWAGVSLSWLDLWMLRGAGTGT